MSRENYYQYRELLPGDLNIQHKIAPSTEKTTFHLHSHMEIIYTISDNLVFFTESKAQHLPSNALLLLDSMSLHYIDYMKNGQDCDRYVLYFNPDLVLSLNTPEINLLDCFVRQKGDGLVLFPDREAREMIQFSLEQMVRPFDGCHCDIRGDASSLPLYDRLFLKLELGQLLTFINRMVLEIHGAPASASYQARSRTVSEICQYIDTHYQEPLTIDQLAREFLMSKTQLYNIFTQIMHISVSDYLSQVRLTQAKSLLLNSQYSVEIISQMVGYGNISSFSRVFKSRTGVSPLHYRKHAPERVSASNL